MKLFFRKKFEWADEREVASKYFDIADVRTEFIGNPQKRVVGRYCIGASYSEYLKDLHNMGCTPINNSSEYQWAAQIDCWYQDLEDFTAKTWFNPFSNNLAMTSMERHGGPFVMRYSTKSKRELWKTHMFCQNYEATKQVYGRLLEDYKYENEVVAVRELLNLRHYPVGDDIFRNAGGMPISKEFRVIRMLGTELARFFYWEPFQEEIEKLYGIQDPGQIPEAWLKSITDIADYHSNFYALDVAQNEDGSWVLIEVNEGQHAGIHTDQYENYYGKMKEVLSI